jgi:hypothetical protein
MRAAFRTLHRHAVQGIQSSLVSSRPIGHLAKPSVSFGITQLIGPDTPWGCMRLRLYLSVPNPPHRGIRDDPLKEGHDSIQSFLGLWITHGFDTSLAARGATDSFSTRDNPYPVVLPRIA